MSSSRTSSSSSHEVILAVYDLSRGMARSLSAQILGGPEYAIDMVPHTGLVVFGHEYFFGAGAGIQKEDPNSFRRLRDMDPVHFISLGHTRVTQADFEQWCHRMTVDGSFGGGSYDLLRRNCNNFSDEAARNGLQLAVGIPDWILQVPHKFLSSPMGMMMRPMLENMQLSGPSSHGASPFAGVAAEAPRAGGAVATSNSRAAVTAAAAVNNPWANIPSLSSTSTNAECPVSPPKKPKPDHHEEGAAEAVKSNPPSLLSNADSMSTTEGRRVVEETLAQPLVSADARMVPMCLSKLKGALSSEEFQVLEAGTKALLDSKSKDASGATQTTMISHSNEVFRILLRVLQDNHHVSFVLLLLRVLVLNLPVEESSNKDGAVKCLAWIQEQLIQGEGGAATATTVASGAPASQRALSPTGRAAAWLTLSNAVASGWLDHLTDVSGTVDAALVDWNPTVQPKAEVRQAASGFLYNVSLQLVVRPPDDRRRPSNSSNVDDVITSILCFGLEGLSEEADATCRLRRCMILGRLLLNQPAAKASAQAPTRDEASAARGEQATVAPSERTTAEDETLQLRRTLAMELGIKNVLTSLLATASAQRSRDDAAVMHSLAKELLSSLV